MSKKYSFSEMIKEYEDGYKGQFKDITDNWKCELIGNVLYWISNKGLSESIVRLSLANMKHKFVKVDKEVPVHEAIKALKEGKEIYSKDSADNKSSYKNTTKRRYLTIEELTTYKWYITE